MNTVLDHKTAGHTINSSTQRLVVQKGSAVLCLSTLNKNNGVGLFLLHSVITKNVIEILSR